MRIALYLLAFLEYQQGTCTTQQALITQAPFQIQLSLFDVRSSFKCLSTLLRAFQGTEWQAQDILKHKLDLPCTDKLEQGHCIEWQILCLKTIQDLLHL